MSGARAGTPGPTPAPAAAAERRRGAGVLLLALSVIALSATLRWVNRATVTLPGGAGWTTYDNDGQYHMRRLARALEAGGAVAGEDPFLNHPDGSLIPWPPYYTRFLVAALGPFAPADAAARHQWIAQAVATVPLVLGALTSGLAVLAGWLLAGALGGAVAGAYHALCLTAINYSKLGVGDHHAAVSLLLGATLLLLCLGLRRWALQRRTPALCYGGAAGLVLGLCLGTWVGAMLYLVQVQCLFAVLLVLRARRPWDGLPWFGLAFHAGVLAAVAPAVLASPWKEQHPWMLVNLSWFHLLQPTLGLLVFVPPLWLRKRMWLRAYPLLVAAALGLLTLVGFGLAEPVRAAFAEAAAWLGRVDPFMAQVRESRSLWGAPPRVVFLLLGYGVVLLPVCWGVMLHRALFRQQEELWPWVVAAPLLAAQAARQNRFADALSLTLAVVVGWGVARAVQAWRARGARRQSGRTDPAWLLGALLLTALLQWPALAQSRETWQVGQRTREAVRQRALWSLCRWLRDHTPADGAQGVLANWGHGHTIEWVAERPTLATNFGTYVGEEGFQAVPRFLLSEDPAEAEALLRSRQARHVLLTSRHPDWLLAHPDLRQRFRRADAAAEGGLARAWFRTLGSRLMLGGLDPFAAPGSGPPRPRFLRLVHVSPTQDPAPPYRDFGPMACGWIWEAVPGARLEAEGAPGTVLQVSFDLRYGPADTTLPIRDAAVADAEGRAVLRLPYQTEGANGDGQRVGEARWTFGDAGGTLRVTGQDVQHGASVRLR